MILKQLRLTSNIEKIITNCYIVQDEQSKETMVIDPAGEVEKIIELLNILNSKLKYIYLTHCHGDHIGGVEAFKKDFPDAKVVACADEKELLSNGDLNSSAEMFGHPVTIDADIYVRDKDKLDVGDMTLNIMQTPGHTTGGICIYVPGVLFSGDTLFCRSIGRTDFYGGDFRQLINSIKDKLFYLPDDTLVLPGHMGQTTIGDEKRGNPFV